MESQRNCSRTTCLAVHDRFNWYRLCTENADNADIFRLVRSLEMMPNRRALNFINDPTTRQEAFKLHYECGEDCVCRPVSLSPFRVPLGDYPSADARTGHGADTVTSPDRLSLEVKRALHNGPPQYDGSAENDPPGSYHDFTGQRPPNMPGLRLSRFSGGGGIHRSRKATPTGPRYPAPVEAANLAAFLLPCSDVADSPSVPASRSVMYTPYASHELVEVDRLTPPVPLSEFPAPVTQSKKERQVEEMTAKRFMERFRQISAAPLAANPSSSANALHPAASAFSALQSEQKSKLKAQSMAMV